MGALRTTSGFTPTLIQVDGCTLSRPVRTKKESFMKISNFSNSLTVVLTLMAVVALSATGDPAHADTFGSGASTFNIAFTTIGNPVNLPDTTGSPNPAGSVPYVYNIGTYDISRDMITKANNVGNLAITLQDMTSFGGNGVNRPATGVSWNEAARFVNWLNTSTGNPKAEGS